MTQVNFQQACQQLNTVQDFVRWTASRLSEYGAYFGHGTDNPWDEAIYLVTHAIHLNDALYPAIQNSKVTEDEKSTLAALIEQRVVGRVPTAYLVNQAYFMGLPFYVDERVLVPRSPIAELLENQLEPWLKGRFVHHVLDLCTGSGCIAIAAAHVFEDAIVDAVDLSPEALTVAEMNIHSLGVSDRVFPMLSDGFDALGEQKYDVILSNPPYVDEEDMESLPDEYRHEPEMGLASGADGLELPRRILAQAADHMTDDGVMILEVGNSEVHLRAQYPDVPFEWVEFQKGGHGVLVITKAQLEQHRHLFQGA
ncbi:50S ribosomal protein L3 N(5)-glutamine methyltransferase [Algicola sagamiensis]|uniref:50S ribosomal protein L3 N(5)-glutamine methyltransferase n=1 Tax=Algicola sagamiensis TaxID=163869 RepID=UPI000477FF32